MKNTFKNYLGALGLFTLGCAAGCFDPGDAKGLSCFGDEDCGPKLSCIEGLCGGPVSEGNEQGDTANDTANDTAGDDTTTGEDGGECQMAGDSCASAECCGGSTCVNFGEQGLFCAADCDSGSDCAGCCCLGLESGRDACGYADLCVGSSPNLCPDGGGCALGFSRCEFSAQCCGDGLCLENLAGDNICFETCDSPNECVTGCCLSGLCQGESACDGDASSVPDNVVAPDSTAL